MLPFKERIGLQITLLWLGIFGVVFFALGKAPLTDIDEGAFSEASREMIARGDWISPWLLDHPRFDKPALIHWLQMASMSAFGFNSFAARLPSAIATIIWIGAIGAWALRIGVKLFPDQDPQRFYFWAILISATAVGIPAIGRAATADALLNMLIALGFLSLWNFFFESGSRWWGRLAALFAGLGLLTKGPVIMLVLGAASGFAALGVAYNHLRTQSDASEGVRPFPLLRDAGRRVLVLTADPSAWLILLGVALPWYVLQYQAQGDAFLHGFFGTHNLGRYVSTMHGFSSGPWYYPVWIFIATLPWLPLCLRTMICILRGRFYRFGELFMPGGVFLFVIVFFSFSATKLPHYGFYGLSGLLCILAIFIVWSSQQSRINGKRMSLLPEKLFLAFLLTLIGALPGWWGLVMPLIVDPYYQLVWKNAGALFSERHILFLVPLLLALLIFLTKSILGLVLASLGFSILLHGYIVPTITTALRGPVLEAATRIIYEEKQSNPNVVTWRLASPSLSFYAGQVIPPAEPAPGMTIVMHQKHHADLIKILESTALLRHEPEVVWASGGLQMVRIR